MLERIINFIYWTVFAVVTIFEVTVVMALFAAMFIPVCAIIVVFVILWCIFHPICILFSWMSNYLNSK